MRYLALASDYDGTLAHDGVATPETLKALERFHHSGRKLILVTGRELPDLESVFPRLDLFDLVVAENGALLFNPATHEKRILAAPPPEAFIQDLKRRGVSDMSVGNVIVATWRPHEIAVLESIRDLGLDLQVIFNKDAVMVLPSGVNKMSGLNRALEELKLSRHNLAGVGDAENDSVFLSCCECSVAVANAIPALKERVDLVTVGERGDGVAELIGWILEADLASLPLQPDRHGILLGHAESKDYFLEPAGNNILLCGQSGGGKSTFVAGVIERLLKKEYQVCLIDPEGDYETTTGCITVGDENSPPSFEQIFQLLESPSTSLIVNLIGVKMRDRPGFFASLLVKLQEKALREARPHWLIVDEAHHLLPSDWAPASAEVAGQTASLMLVTVHPEHVSPAALKLVHTVAIVGKCPHETVQEFAKAVSLTAPEVSAQDLPPGEALIWSLGEPQTITHIRTEPGHAERKRHKRKYAEGELEPERVFYFRGPEGKLNLRVQNLSTFLQITEGIDDETWNFHLHRGDFSKWFAQAIKDKQLAEEVESIERDYSLVPLESRKAIAKAVASRYTAPA